MDSNAVDPQTGAMAVQPLTLDLPPNRVPPDTIAAGGAPRWRLADLQALSQVEFEAALAQAVEHAPWVARRAWASRPFEDINALVCAMRDVILDASAADQIALLRGHPELAGVEARAGRMTADSTTEQGRLGLDRLDAATLDRLQTLNRRYRDRFDHPLVVALRLHADLASVLHEAERRLANAAGAERLLSLQQVCEVMSGRVRRLVSDDADATTRATTGAPASPDPVA
jgi:2-oxo-4-hydroxy-4-carboxy-5-ureidoimidazoline decarboxylase